MIKAIEMPAHGLKKRNHLLGNLEKMNKILIIGCGGIGSRHLQALSKINLMVEIIVVDKSAKSIDRARAIFNEMRQNDLIKCVKYSSSLESIDFDVDVAIIATNSNVRKKIIEKIIEKINVKYFILEKVAFQSVDCFKEVIDLMIKNNSKAWVNCVNRLFPAYKDLKRNIFDNGNLTITVEGGDWGIAGNCIHYIDLFNFLTEKNIYDIDTNRLEKKYYDSKRDGFIDFNGQIVMKSDDGSTLNLINNKFTDRTVVLNISSDDYRYIIFQHAGKAIIQSKARNWDWKEIEFPIVPQSQLTNIIVEDIINKNSCGLSSIEKSFLLHEPMIVSFNSFIKSIDGTNQTFCPIT